MAIPKPTNSNPQDPRDENQLDPGPLVSARVIPDVAPIDKKRFAHGKFGGRTMKVGKR